MCLKNKNIIFKIRRSKVTDYAALIPTDRIDIRYVYVLQAKYLDGYSHNVCICTVAFTKSDRDVIFCLQLLSKIITCTFALS